MAVVLTGCSNSKSESSGSNQTEKKPISEKSENGKPSQIDESQIVFFWGDGCSHCENVEKYFAENDKLDEKLGIKKMEVFKNKENQKLFMEIVDKCKLPGGGVPVLYKDGQCTVGDTPIIAKLKQIK